MTAAEYLQNQSFQSLAFAVGAEPGSGRCMLFPQTVIMTSFVTSITDKKALAWVAVCAATFFTA